MRPLHNPATASQQRLINQLCNGLIEYCLPLVMIPGSWPGIINGEIAGRG